MCEESTKDVRYDEENYKCVKETCVREKRPIFVERDLCHERPAYLKRDLQMCKETYQRRTYCHDTSSM